MTLKERIATLDALFKALEREGSRNAKQSLIDNARREDCQLASDLIYALEVLDGKHKLGYTYYKTDKVISSPTDNISLSCHLGPLFSPKMDNDFSRQNIERACLMCSEFSYFVEPLMNRTWRLGIGKSVLAKQANSPMLAKKYDPNKIHYSHAGYYITEKLDGNRCIAKYEDGCWQFFSRNGKAMKVSFDMRQFSPQYIYDGEVLGKGDFNKVNGIVNRKDTNEKCLVYHIFDVLNIPNSYTIRRAFLSSLENSDDVKVLPLLAYYQTREQLEENMPALLQQVVESGGEGLMINLGNRYYEQKRTDSLLKVKQTQTMDMEVYGLTEGTGKHEGTVGALCCECLTKDETYQCKVGSGLSDFQRIQWANNPDAIIGKIVEVAYFSISQGESEKGSRIYSLRFPRLKRVREDKDSTSPY